MTAYKRLIALDFDGVLHSYSSPWTDAATISDPPTPGAMAFLRALVDDDRFEVVIVSASLKDVDGYDAVAVWLDRELRAAFGNNGIYVFGSIRFSVERPPAFVTIDDRAITFTGTWPALDEIVAFKPWNKRPPADAGAHDRRVEDAVRYAVQGGAGFATDAERMAAELGARRALSLFTGEVGMFDPAFVTEGKVA